MLTYGLVTLGFLYAFSLYAIQQHKERKKVDQFNQAMAQLLADLQTLFGLQNSAVSNALTAATAQVVSADAEVQEQIASLSPAPTPSGNSGSSTPAATPATPAATENLPPHLQ